MKRRIALLLSLLIIVSLFPLAVSEAGGGGGAYITVDGQRRFLDWDNIFGKDGRLEIKIKGFKKNDKGADFGNLAVLGSQKEYKADRCKDDGNGICIYYFDKAEWPQAIVFYPKDGTGRRIVLWKDDGVTIVTATYVGKWTGTAVPKEGGEAFPVTAELDINGNGQFKYKRSEDNMGMFSFIGQMVNGKLNATVANGVMPITRIKGSIKYNKNGTLKGTVTITFRDGEKEQFTIKLTKAGGDEDDEEELDVEQQEDLGVVYR